MKNIYLYFVLILFALGLNFISKEFIGSEQLIEDYLVENCSYQYIEFFLETQQKLNWLGYLITPLFLLIKVLLISAIINLGCLFYDCKLSFKKILTITLKAKFIFLFVIILKTAWFYFIQSNVTLEDLQYFYPLSALNVSSYQRLQPWFMYPFQVLSLYELFYWFILVYLICKELNGNIDKGFLIVGVSYAVSSLIWVVGVMSFTLTMI